MENSGCFIAKRKIRIIISLLRSDNIDFHKLMKNKVCGVKYFGFG